MKASELISINIIPQEISSSLFAQSEQGLSHTPYKDEIRLFSCIKQGDMDRLIAEIKPFIQSGIFVGEMSSDDIRQYRYMAVSAITLATRYAIQGGLDEFRAYHFSDEFIREIDSINTPVKILEHLAGNIIELTNLVNENKEKMKYSPHIRKAVAYINKNINKKITVSELSEKCSISSDYLSHIFKKEMGINLTAYILKQKLEIAKTLLWEGYDNKKICKSLSFRSQSYFISSFKKEYGITPTEYRSQMK